MACMALTARAPRQRPAWLGIGGLAMRHTRGGGADQDIAPSRTTLRRTLTVTSRPTPQSSTIGLGRSQVLGQELGALYLSPPPSVRTLPPPPPPRAPEQGPASGVTLRVPSRLRRPRRSALTGSSALSAVSLGAGKCSDLRPPTGSGSLCGAICDPLGQSRSALDPHAPCTRRGVQSWAGGSRKSPDPQTPAAASV